MHTTQSDKNHKINKPMTHIKSFSYQNICIFANPINVINIISICIVMNKKAIFTMVLAGFLGLAQAQNNSTSLEHIKSVTAVSKVLGDGRKVSTVILEYDTPISNKSLSAGSYAASARR